MTTLDDTDIPDQIPLGVKPFESVQQPNADPTLACQTTLISSLFVQKRKYESDPDKDETRPDSNKRTKTDEYENLVAAPSNEDHEKEQKDQLKEKARLPKTIGFRMDKSQEKVCWLEYNPVIGDIGTFTADRADDFDPFVVVDVSQDKETLSIVFPRMRLNSTHTGVDDIQFGVDKLTETFESKTKCACPLPCQGGDFFCRCGADHQIAMEYAQSFSKIDTETYLYEVAKVKRFEKGFIYVGFLDVLPEQDLPFSGSCCRC